MMGKASRAARRRLGRRFGLAFSWMLQNGNTCDSIQSSETQEEKKAYDDRERGRGERERERGQKELTDHPESLGCI